MIFVNNYLSMSERNGLNKNYKYILCKWARCREAWL